MRLNPTFAETKTNRISKEFAQIIIVSVFIILIQFKFNYNRNLSELYASSGLIKIDCSEPSKVTSLAGNIRRKNSVGQQTAF
ncbi:hypothetical protein CREGCYN_04780 [Synechococcus sp. M16CYN]